MLIKKCLLLQLFVNAHMHTRFVRTMLLRSLICREELVYYRVCVYKYYIYVQITHTYASEMCHERVSSHEQVQYAQNCISIRTHVSNKLTFKQ